MFENSAGSFRPGFSGAFQQVGWLWKDLTFSPEPDLTAFSFVGMVA